MCNKDYSLSLKLWIRGLWRGCNLVNLSWSSCWNEVLPPVCVEVLHYSLFSVYLSKIKAWLSLLQKWQRNVTVWLHTYDKFFVVIRHVHSFTHTRNCIWACILYRRWQHTKMPQHPWKICHTQTWWLHTPENEAVSQPTKQKCLCHAQARSWSIQQNVLFLSPCLLISAALRHQPHIGASPHPGALAHWPTWGKFHLSDSTGNQTTNKNILHALCVLWSGCDCFPHGLFQRVRVCTRVHVLQHRRGVSC